MLLYEENKGCDLVQKNKAAYLKTSFSFCLKIAEKLETHEKEELYTCQSGKTADFSYSYQVSF